MSRSLSFKLCALLLLGAFLLAGCARAGEDTIKIGLNVELTGNIPKVGEHSRVAAEMFVEEINAAGG